MSMFVMNCYLLYLLRSLLGVFGNHHRKAVELPLAILIMPKKIQNQK